MRLPPRAELGSFGSRTNAVKQPKNGLNGQGLVDVKNLTDAVRESEVILSVCPPDAALDLARKRGEHNFKGVYVDANAISRTTAEEIRTRQ